VDEAIKPLFNWSCVQVGLMNDFLQISKGNFEELAGKVLGI